MLGLIALEVHEDKKLNLKTWQKHLIITACIIFAFPADWSSPGALAILYMGIYNDSMKKKMAALIVCIAMYSIVYAICLNTLYGIMQMGIVLAIPLLYGYNGKRGKWKGMKWLFYIYYPAHLTILGLIRIFLLKRAMN
jgi:predicted small secreted protein